MTKVLYVDDEPDIREIAELALSLDPDFEVRSVASGSDALACLETWLPDIVLLDVMMPGMDGPTTLAALREIDAARNLPVVFITARAQPSEIQAFTTLDAVGVIAKPFNPIDLASQVRALLG